MFLFLTKIKHETSSQLNIKFNYNNIHLFIDELPLELSRKKK